MDNKQRSARRHRRSVTLALASPLIGLALALAACGGGDDGATPTPSPLDGASPTASGTPTPVPSPVTTEAGMALDEFAIRPEATRARPGTVVFKVRNEGTVTHQFLVIRSDLKISELPRRDNNAGADEDQLDVTGKIDSIEPGAEAEVSVPVQQGQYVLICNIVAGEVSHYLSGMYNRFEVTPTAPLPPPSQ